MIRDMMKKLFVWSLFKVEIKESDKFIYVDETRASAEVMRLDDRQLYGKCYYPWMITVIFGGILLALMMSLSLNWGE